MQIDADIWLRLNGIAVTSFLPITVCIVTHRRPDLLKQLLCALSRCQLPSGFQEVIVVENGGCEESIQVVHDADPSLHAVRLCCPSPIKSAALNLALTRIPEGLVVFIDDDASPKKNWLIAYTQAAARNPEKRYFGGPFTVQYDVPPKDWLLRFLPLSAIGSETCQRVNPVIAKQFLGFNWAAYVSDLKQIGGFSTYFGPGTPRGGGDESFAQMQLRSIDVHGEFVENAVVSHYVPVENCSPEWLLRRTMGAGMTSGIAYEQRCRETGTRIKPYRSILRRVRQWSRFSDLLSLLTFRQPGRYWLKYWLIWSQGFLQGIREGVSHRPLESADGRSRGLDADHQDGGEGIDLGVPAGDIRRF